MNAPQIMIHGGACQERGGTVRLFGFGLFLLLSSGIGASHACQSGGKGVSCGVRKVRVILQKRRRLSGLAAFLLRLVAETSRARYALGLILSVLVLASLAGG